MSTEKFLKEGLRRDFVQISLRSSQASFICAFTCAARNCLKRFWADK